jgi:hypothetical protein
MRTVTTSEPLVKTGQGDYVDPYMAGSDIGQWDWTFWALIFLCIAGLTLTALCMPRVAIGIVIGAAAAFILSCF